jgi:molecular chaperone GrpE
LIQKKEEKTETLNEVKPKVKKPSAAQKLQAEIENLKEVNAKSKDQYLRLLAEFDNFRKRRLADNIECSIRVKREIVLQILPILDDLERLLSHPDNSANNASITNGAKLISEKFLKILTDIGLKPMEVEGKPFDPELHQALTIIEIPNVQSGMVVEVYEPGYFLDYQVLRHAKVIVSK